METIKKVIVWLKNGNTRSRAFREGRKVRTDGFDYNTNPYLPGTSEHKWWDGGWYAVNERLKEEGFKVLESIVDKE